MMAFTCQVEKPTFFSIRIFIVIRKQVCYLMLSYSISSVWWWTNNDPTNCHFGNDSNKFIHKVLMYSSQGLTIASDLLRYMFRGALLSAVSMRGLSFTFGISPKLSSWSWLTLVSPQSECRRSNECIDFAATNVFCRLLMLPQLLSWCSVFLKSISKECPLHSQNCATYFECTIIELSLRVKLQVKNWLKDEIELFRKSNSTSIQV